MYKFIQRLLFFFGIFSSFGYADEFADEFSPLKLDARWTEDFIAKNQLVKKIPLNLWRNLEAVSQFERGRRFIQIVVSISQGQEQRHLAVSWDIDSGVVESIKDNGEVFSTKLNNQTKILLESCLSNDFIYIASPYGIKEEDTFSSVKYMFRVKIFGDDQQSGSYTGYRINLFKSVKDCATLDLDYSQENKICSLILMLLMYTNR